MNPFETIGMSRVVNAAGKMTYLGSSSILPGVIRKMGEVAQSYVDMEVLKVRVGRLAAQKIGAEAGCITACCAAGISVAVAAVLTGKDINKVEALPAVTWKPNKVIIQKGHVVNFGANISQGIKLTGAELSEIGSVNQTKPYHLEAGLDENAAAVVYVVSHHAVANGMIDLAETIKIAHNRSVPVIVDAAAEVDLKKYAGSGADLVVFSGHKAIGGPTSGLIVGKEELIAACQAQDKGIARMMKVGKENIMGLYFALEEYQRLDEKEETDRQVKLIEELERYLSKLPNVATKISWDATRPIPRLQLIVERSGQKDAKMLIKQMEENNPSIRTRNHLADQGIIQFDPRELKSGDIPIIYSVLQKLV